MRITREPLKKIPVLRESDLIVLVCGLVFGGGGDSSYNQGWGSLM